MNIDLMIKGEKKTFKTNFVSARQFRKVMEFDEKIDYTAIDTNDLDELIDFVCEVFDNQFTVEQFYDGIPAHKTISTITDVFIYVRTGKTPEELEKEQKDDDLGK